MGQKVIEIDYLKDHLVVDHNYDDVLLFNMIEDAHARFQQYVSRPIFGEEQYTEAYDGGTSRIVLSMWPFKEDSVSVRDLDNEEDLEDDEFIVDNILGFVFYSPSNSHSASRFPRGTRRWQITYLPGLEYHPSWDIWIKNALRSSLRDLIAAWYEDRTGHIVEERFGGGSVTSFRSQGIPERVEEVWKEIGAELI